MPELDRLYDLLPTVYRQRDVVAGHPLRELLRVLSREIELVESDIRRLYDNWFVETCDDWVIPYLSDLIGSAPTVADDGAVPALVPRRQIANVVRARRRKGTLALLEELARDAADWPAVAVELRRLVGTTHHLDHPDAGVTRLADLHDAAALELLGTAFDRFAHTAEVRRPSSLRRRGRHHPGGVAVFAHVLQAFPVTRCRARNLEEPGPHCYTFNVLGSNTPLYTKAVTGDGNCRITTAIDLPRPITRRALAADKAAYYGEERSFVVYTIDRDGVARAVPAARVVPADLGDWEAYRARRGTVLVDPMLGRLLFPEVDLPRGVLVSYHHGFTAPLGGGEYNRTLHQARASRTYVVSRALPEPKEPEPGRFRSVQAAIAQWLVDQDAADAAVAAASSDADRLQREAERAAVQHAVVEIRDSGVYTEQIAVALRAKQSLQIRAANRARPVIRLLDMREDLPDALEITGSPGARLTLDGLTIAGRPIHLKGDFATITIRHTTLVPGWGLEQTPEDPAAPPRPSRPEEPSLQLYDTHARVHVTDSILGSIQVHQSAVHSDPLAILLENSILDATALDTEALSGIGTSTAHAVLTVRRSTILGTVDVHAIELGEDSIFAGRVRVARRHHGCLRYSSIAPESRTPRRYRCQPDLAEADAGDDPAWRQLARDRVRPEFTSTAYGTPTYARLAAACDDAIRRGAADHGEMGAFHDVREPDRAALLAELIDENVPADVDAGLVTIA
jgi:hypothetical protein